MSMPYKKLAIVASVFLVLAIPTYQHLIASDADSHADSSQSLTGDYLISVTTGTIDAKMVSSAEPCQIAGQPFLRCKLIDSDAMKERYRGTTCYVAVSEIVSIQELPAKE